MLFDEIGLPYEPQASDKQDSSRLAGIMALFDWPQEFKIEKYVISESGKLKYARHPLERRYDFSRDQALCLVAGLYKHYWAQYVSLNAVDGKDIFLPSHRGHFKRCALGWPSLIEKAWLWLDVLYHAHVKPLSEPNQILSMMYVAYFQSEKHYLKYWLKHNKQWRQSILDYWALSYRQEVELANHMIKKLENIN